MKELLLGSGSPRRQELLTGLDIPFRKVKIDAEESFPAELKEGEIPLYLAKLKAAAYIPQLADNEVLLTADTIVWIDGQILGKPANEQEAEEMIRLLSGKTHQVYTGVALTFRNENRQAGRLPHVEQITFVDRTDVTFGELTDEQIHYYVSHYKPMDKAGAYGVQEWIGYVACTRIEGSFYNVMGLPVHKVAQALKQLITNH